MASIEGVLGFGLANAVFSVQCKCVYRVRPTSDILLFGKLNCLLDAPSSSHPVENWKWFPVNSFGSCLRIRFEARKWFVCWEQLIYTLLQAKTRCTRPRDGRTRVYVWYVWRLVHVGIDLGVNVVYLWIPFVWVVFWVPAMREELVVTKRCLVVMCIHIF